MKSRWSWSLALCTSVLALPLCAQQKSPSMVTLRYTPPPEKGWVYDLQISDEQRQSLMGFGEGDGTTEKIATKTTFHLLPHPSTADTIKIRLQMDSVSLHFHSPELGYAIDTVIIPANRVSVYALSPSGQLYSVHQESTDTTPSSPFTIRIVPSHQQLALWRLPLPKTAIPVGHRWTAEEQDTTTQNNQQLIVSAQTAYTLEAIVDTLGHRCARIRTERSNITLRGKGQTEYGNFSLEGSGRSQGLVYIELSTGFPVVRTEKVDMELTFAMQGQVELLSTSSRSSQLVLQRR